MKIFTTLLAFLLFGQVAQSATVAPIFTNDTVANSIAFNDTFGHTITIGSYNASTGAWSPNGAGGSSGSFTTLTVSGNGTIGGTFGITGVITANNINAAAGTFTTLSASTNFQLPGATSGVATFVSQAVAGTATITAPNASGTIAVSATSPLVLNATTGNLTYIGGGAATMSTPADPSGTTSTTDLMMGLAGTITPSTTGRVKFTITGSANSTTAADGCQFRVRYGTGAAPGNGVALTGTGLGALTRYSPSSTAIKAPFSVTGFATGLAIGTPVWIDLEMGAVIGGTASLYTITVVAVEF